MKTISKLALVAALTTLVAAPAFAIDQQASEAALENANTPTTSGAYASVQRAPRAERIVLPTQTQDFQAGSN